MPARRTKPSGTPTPIPTPTATWSSLGRTLEEGVTTAAVGEGESSDKVDDVEDGSTEELVEREARVVGAALGVADPMVVCIVAGPESREKSWDGSEQHPESLRP